MFLFFIYNNKIRVALCLIYVALNIKSFFFFLQLIFLLLHFLFELCTFSNHIISKLFNIEFGQMDLIACWYVFHPHLCDYFILWFSWFLWNTHFANKIQIHNTHIKFINKLFIILKVKYFNTHIFVSRHNIMSPIIWNILQLEYFLKCILLHHA